MYISMYMFNIYMYMYVYIFNNEYVEEGGANWPILKIKK